VLLLQNSEEDQFLFDTTVQATVRETTAELAKIHNLRHRITRLKLEGEELAKYGPAKQPDQQGIDQYSEQPVQQGQFYNMDPTGRRTGDGKHCLCFACVHLLPDGSCGQHFSLP
jgi:hypothetical protein